MTMNSARTLDETIAELHRKFGSRIIQRGSKVSAPARDTLSTGYQPLDGILTGNGIPCKATTLLRGVPTSGATTLAYHIVAEAQQHDLVIVYVDCTNAFDGQYAVKQCRVDEDQLLLIIPASLTDAFSIIRDLIPLPYHGLIVLNAGSIEAEDLPGTDELPQLLGRIEFLLRDSNWTVLAHLPVEAGQVSKPYVALDLIVNWKQWIEPPGYTGGYASLVTVTKHAFGRFPSSVQILIPVE